MLYKERINKIDYILVFILVANSGFAFFYIFKPAHWFFTFIILIYYFYKDGKFNRFFWHYISFMAVIFIGQSLIFRDFPIYNFLSFYTKIVFAYIVLMLLQEKFIKAYINIIYVFSIISFIFYFSGVIFPNFKNIMVYNITPFFNLMPSYYKSIGFEPHSNILIFCYNTFNWEYFRNSGPFWEPGAFGGFLLIAIIFEYLVTNKILSNKNKIFILAIITTFSTTAYIFLFVLFVIYLLKIKKYQSYLALLFIIPLIIFLYLSLDFLNQKIESNIYRTEKMGELDITRFTSAMLDLNTAIDYPFFGTGTSFAYFGMDKITYAADRYDLHRNNGVFNIMATYGFIAFFIYFYLMFKSFKYLCKLYDFDQSYGKWFLLLIVIAGFSQGYFILPFFISLTMMHKTIVSSIASFNKSQIIK